MSAIKVLVAEDSRVQRELLRRGLEAAGYQVTVAADGEEALALAEAHPPRAVITDVNMPRLDGYGLCRALRGHPGLAQVPVVLLTELSAARDVISGLNAGADAYVIKPYDLAFLCDCLKRLLSRNVGQGDGALLGAEFDGRALEVSPRSQQQLLDLLLSTYGSAVMQNRSLLRAQQELTQLNARLQDSNQGLADANRALKEAQQELVFTAKMSALGQLVAGVAHEINNPLAFLSAHQDTVIRALRGIGADTDTQLSDSARRQLDKALQRLADSELGLTRIRDLVLSLRTFSRRDEGELKVVSLEECIASTLKLLGHRLNGGRIRIQREHDAVASLECYAGAFNQVLMNLICNAVDAVEGEGTVTISTRAEGEMLRLAVADDGHGIADEALPHIFDPFFTTKPVGQGVGLGLSISHSIVEKHGGTLEAKRLQPRGTEMVVRIPLRQQ